MPETYDVTIQKIIVETPEVKSFHLGPLPDTFTFDPGQFVTIVCDIPGESKTIRRAYSIGNPPTRNGYVEVTIRKMDGGRLSTYLCDNVEEGLPLKIIGPYGKFVYQESMSDKLVLIGAGSGVVPLMSMIRYVRDKSLPVDIKLLYSSKDADFIIYRQELEELEAEMDNLTVFHTLTRVEGDNWTGFRGRISKEMVQQCVNCEEDVVGSRYYICGPPAMVDSAVSFLNELGAVPESIQVEKYD